MAKRKKAPKQPPPIPSPTALPIQTNPLPTDDRWQSRGAIESTFRAMRHELDEARREIRKRFGFRAAEILGEAMERMEHYAQALLDDGHGNSDL